MGIILLLNSFNVRWMVSQSRSIFCTRLACHNVCLYGVSLDRSKIPHGCCDYAFKWTRRKLMTEKFVHLEF